MASQKNPSFFGSQKTISIKNCSPKMATSRIQQVCKNLSESARAFLASVWSLNETSESKLLIIERPVCASTSEFEYVTIDSKTLTLVWSPPGVDLSAGNWKSKLLHFQEFGNPPKAGCEDENGEFCEEYTGTVQIVLLS